MSRPARRWDENSADAELLRTIGQGDPRGLDQLFVRFRRPAFALARRILADDVLAEDVLQDVFLTVWRDPGAFDRSRGSAAAWLLAVVHDRAVEAVRREESHRRRRARAEEDLARGVPTAARSADAAADADRIRVALGGLPTLQREALTLAYYGGYTQREVAALTGAPLGTVKTRMLAGMRRLREELEEPAGGRFPGGALGGAAPVDGTGR